MISASVMKGSIGRPGSSARMVSSIAATKSARGYALS
jgi:hypothetical protein